MYRNAAVAVINSISPAIVLKDQISGNAETLEYIVADDVFNEERNIELSGYGSGDAIL